MKDGHSSVSLRRPTSKKSLACARTSRTRKASCLSDPFPSARRTWWSRSACVSVLVAETGEDYVVVFDSVDLSTQVTEYRVGSPEHSLTAGSTVRFKVTAYNYNGAGNPSEIAALLICG